MSYPRRIQFNGALYHVFNRGICRKSIFLSPRHNLFFLELLDRIVEKYGVEIYCYCIMKNHFHILIHTPYGNIAQVMQYLASNLAKFINKELNADGALFKRRYKEVLVDSESYLLQVSRYIHLNPVQAKLVKKAEQWKWSSIHEYYGQKDKTVPLTTNKILTHFKDANEYQEYINLGIDKHTRKFYEKKYTPRILGTTEFKNRIKKLYLKKSHVSLSHNQDKQPPLA
ncbi:transposase [Candidatus Margulisiibacteriota bacterium]